MAVTDAPALTAQHMRLELGVSRVIAYVWHGHDLAGLLFSRPDGSWRATASVFHGNVELGEHAHLWAAVDAIVVHLNSGA